MYGLAVDPPHPRNSPPKSAARGARRTQIRATGPAKALQGQLTIMTCPGVPAWRLQHFQVIRSAAAANGQTYTVSLCLKTTQRHVPTSTECTMYYELM